jgi:hypothetical protein
MSQFFIQDYYAHCHHCRQTTLTVHNVPTCEYCPTGAQYQIEAHPKFNDGTIQCADDPDEMPGNSAPCFPREITLDEFFRLNNPFEIPEDIIMRCARCGSFR